MSHILHVQPFPPHLRCCAEAEATDTVEHQPSELTEDALVIDGQQTPCKCLAVLSGLPRYSVFTATKLEE